jgi:hypothetical protein
MQPVEHRTRRELAISGRRLGSSLLTRYALLDPLMGPGVVEVGLVLLHDPVQVAFVEDDEVVETDLLALEMLSSACPVRVDN